MAEQTQTYQIQLRSQSRQNQEQHQKNQKQTKTKKNRIKNKKIEKDSKMDSNPLNFGNISTIDIQSHASCFQDIQNLQTNLDNQDELLNIAFINQSQFSNLTETSNNEFSLQDFNQNLASFLQNQNYEFYKDKIEQSLQNLEFKNYLQTRKREEFYDDVGNQIKKCLKIKN